MVRASTTFLLSLSFILSTISWGSAKEPYQKPTHLDQNWQAGWEVGQTDWFHHASQGTMIVPFDWFMSLEQPTLTPAAKPQLFSDPKYLQQFGFLPGEQHPKYNPGNLPIGFAIAHNWVDPNNTQPTPPVAAVGLTCAACHTSEITYQQHRVRIEGGSPMINLGAFQKALGTSLLITNSSAQRFERFANRWWEKQKLPPQMEQVAKAKLKAALEQAVAKGLQEQKLEAEKGLHTLDAGFSRTDALARIGNKVFGKLSSVNLSETDAPVNFPHLWDTPWFYWVQYNASIRQPMVRNIGEALGVGAAVNAADEHLSTFVSTVDVKNLHLMEDQLAGGQPFTGLKAPAWPETLFGEIEGFAEQSGLWKEGKALYETHCIHCHYRIEDYQQHLEVADKDGTYWSKPNRFNRKFMKLPYVNVVDMGTDPAAAVKFYRRIVYVGSQQGSEKRGLISAVDALGFVTGKVREHEYAKLKLSPAEYVAYDGFRELGPEPAVIPRLAYKARPLNGIWATAPFLHNGSVANLYELLLPADQRMKTFYLGSIEFDPKHVGFDTQWRREGFLLDTSLPGNLNTGHEFRNLTAAEQASLTPFQRKKLAEGKGWAVNGVLGPELTDEERWALIEYVKSLGSPLPGQEFPPVGETMAIKKLAQIQGMIQQYQKPGPTKRGQHPKSHGVVRATVQVADDLPDQYKVGIFAEPKDYQAVIRFSNGDQQDDRQPDIHGMAIKMDVPSKHDPDQTQDYVLADNPVFFAKNVEDLLRFLELKRSSADISKLLAEFPQLATYRKPLANPLEATYFSQTPYKFGDTAVKYVVVPCRQNKLPDSNREQPVKDKENVKGDVGAANFLRNALQQRLTAPNQPARFDFCIQLQTDVAAMPIEDATVEWKSKRIKLATITIQPQQLDALKDQQNPEDLSFNPWHSLPEHRPLGGINRARRLIYEASSKVRHAAKK
jgi:mono/diheme cytochrome c family protein